MTKKIVLIQVWLGPLPEYFQYHFKTIKDLNCIDFLFFTDQKVDFKSDNFKVHHIDKSKLENLIHQKTNHKINLSNKFYKINDLKASYGHLFEEKILDDDYFGFYDIDTLFGDISKLLNPYINEFDVISFGGEYIFNRTSGPFTLMRNNPTMRNLYSCEYFFKMLEIDETVAFEEDYFFENLIKPNHTYKILNNVCNFICEEGYHTEYESIWSNGKLEINGEEKMIFHFYDKKNTTFKYSENSIITGHKKNLIDDFFWVTYLTEDYEKLVLGLINSIKKYSNRKCLLYTINYDSNLKHKLNDQFIFTRLDLERGKIEKNGRDITVLCSKPIVLSDSIDFIPEGKFIYIDTDIYLTNTADNLNKYFDSLEDYPLLNSHIHDKIIANDVYETGEWVSPIDILSKATEIPVEIFPRRKANVIIYDKKSKWFFEEQMELYFKHKDYDPAIFRLHDEDSANILLSKYNFTKSLPLIDMEESDTLDIDKFNNYSYNMTSISKHVILPSNKNKLHVFHGFKDPEFYKKIEKKYGNSVLKIQDIIFKYENNTLFFIKNNFLIDKEIDQEVNFNLYDLTGKLLFSLNNQLIFNYWTFYISNISLNLSEYFVEISESNTQRIIYKNLLKISN